MDASHNQLTYIPSGLFLLPNLATLQLSYNLLNHLPGDPDDVTAQDTSGVCPIPPMFLPPYHHTQSSLPCSHVPLVGLPPNIRWTCEKLKKIDLSHNRLRGLPDTFDELRRLSVIHLSHNYLKELPQSCCWGCVNLVS